jgi:hypothetical protein
MNLVNLGVLSLKVEAIAWVAGAAACVLGALVLCLSRIAVSKRESGLREILRDAAVLVPVRISSARRFQSLSGPPIGSFPTHGSAAPPGGAGPSEI